MLPLAMDGIHDVGGMQGFAAVDPVDDVVGYHEEWEKLAHSAAICTLGSGVHNMDEFRHAIERLTPDRHLNVAYYDRWLMAASTLAVEKGVISPQKLSDRTEAIATGDAEVPQRNDPDRFDEILDGVIDAYDVWRDRKQPAFETDDQVRVHREHPQGHTRCPGYVRGARGTIVSHRGTHTLPDAHAHGQDGAEPVYNIAFELDELWPDRDSDGGIIHAELWESYLEEIDE